MNENDKGCAGLAIKDSVLPVRDARDLRNRMDWVQISDGPPIPEWYARAIFKGWKARSGIDRDYDEFRARYPKFLDWESMINLYNDKRPSNGCNPKAIIDAALAQAAPASPPATEDAGGLSSEQQRAMMEGECNAASHSYFSVRSDMLNTTANHNIFDAGFQRGYELRPTASGAGKLAAPASPDLQSIEQYQVQMAAIGAAAIGYWTEAESILPEYDTVPLRDVAKLYAKYAALHEAARAPASPASAPEAPSFRAWFESEGRAKFASMFGVCIDNDEARAMIAWNACSAALATPLPPVVARKVLTDEDIERMWRGHVVPVFGMNGINANVFARAIERHLMGESE